MEPPTEPLSKKELSETSRTLYRHSGGLSAVVPKRTLASRLSSSKDAHPSVGPTMQGSLTHTLANSMPSSKTARKRKAEAEHSLNPERRPTLLMRLTDPLVEEVESNSHRLEAWLEGRTSRDHSLSLIERMDLAVVHPLHVVHVPEDRHDPAPGPLSSANPAPRDTATLAPHGDTTTARHGIIDAVDAAPPVARTAPAARPMRTRTRNLVWIRPNLDSA
ncbi:hypothetical protein FB451DRAFT_160181 [Mycena latifolia]|nr:hypothetical protein FB451DRAFT_160181 [Mycena latifolia]